MDVLVGVIGLEEQQLRDHDVRDVVVDPAPQEDDSVAQQPRIDVERALTALILFDHHRDQGHASLQRPRGTPGPKNRLDVQVEG
jgi:hypothetical protein